MRTSGIGPDEQSALTKFMAATRNSGPLNTSFLMRVSFSLRSTVAFVSFCFGSARVAAGNARMASATVVITLKRNAMRLMHLSRFALSYGRDALVLNGRRWSGNSDGHVR